MPRLRKKGRALAIAATLKRIKPDESWLAEIDNWRLIVRAFSDDFAPADRHEFYAACGLPASMTPAQWIKGT